MKNLLPVMLVSFLVSCTTMPTSNQELGDGYPFGSTRDFVLAAMEADQFEPFDVSEDVIWHEQLIHGYMVSTAYLFDSDQCLSGAAWLVWDRSAVAFEALNEILANHFAVDFIDVSANGITKFELSRDEIRVLHLRDPSENSHSVHYYPTDS